MNQLLSITLSLLVTYGYPTVAIVVLLSGFGIPLPASTIILAAGSFTVDGTLNFWSLVAVVTVCAIVGDLLGYLLAHRFGIQMTWLSKKLGITAKQLASVDQFLLRWGVWSIFFTRWLITPLGFPVNLGAGFRRYSLRKFTLFITIGEFLWAFIYAYVGHVFGSSWSSLVDYINGAPEVLALLVIALLSATIAWRMWPKKKLELIQSSDV